MLVVPALAQIGTAGTADCWWYEYSKVSDTWVGPFCSEKECNISLSIGGLPRDEDADCQQILPAEVFPKSQMDFFNGRCSGIDNANSY